MTGETDATPEAAETDVLVVGSGVAGCATALSAAREGADVLVVTKATRPEETTSHWAQGGVATTRSDPETFERDILAASADTADPEAVEVLVEESRDAVEDVLVETLDVPFDRATGEDADRAGADADFDYGREAAHSEPRILHVDASTGKHVLGPFLSHLDDHERVTVREDTAALDLITREGRVHGAVVDGGRDDATEPEPVFAGATVLATGGIGALYENSTNPETATGDGIAMAALAGADVEDMAYVQFHPTAYAGSEARSASKRSGEAAKRDDPFLVSEAVRGEGALLRNADGERFMPDYHDDAELAPRDVVARAVADEREATGEVRLDVSPLDFESEFPDLAAKCEARGVDWSEGIPVEPSEHFLCGGIAVDDRGRTNLDRLFAVGECARTGVHGANRLASTSLLEGLVWGLRAGESAAGHAPERVEAPDLRDSDPDLPSGFAREKFVRLRRVMDERVGIRRTPDGLRRATAVLRRLKGEVDAYTRTRTSRSLYELRNASVVALLVARDALDAEPVGCHALAEESTEVSANASD
ncbi:FAD-dependent oxidoreductase [Halorussus gelatinilyticus]|uniref:L-aspartate oxidase n=1 Tax=Halorussus gelatinilyticus TaxID=2937524 RepID=A0A8U0IIQ6_9EURY|nr:FAD-dependent oxidoreductase [Halorussus gelatinilyticus]UPW00977.1 FAD-dependent oxidoreductase [Halorussus gelatinilyticus]